MEDSTASTESLERGRVAFERQAWGAAYAELSRADNEGSLGPEDLDRLALAAYLTGEQDVWMDAWTRAHNEFLSRGERESAVQCSFRLALGLIMHDEPAQASGWLSRSRRVLDDAGLDCVERGYLLVPAALEVYWGGDTAAGHAMFAEAAEIGVRFQEADLTALARLGMGETLVHLGNPRRGIPLLDEAMASVLAGEVSPLIVGMIYCAMLDCCTRIFDMRRAQEWTAAFARWCEAQPDLVPYRGDCLVNRAEIMRLRGEWPDAMEEVRRACERLALPSSRSWAGSAFYQQGEVHRLRGEFGEAEDAYRETSRWGRSPQPGLALLRLAQGRPDAAVSAISLALAEAGDAIARSRLLPAQVEISLAAGHVEAARAAAGELAQIAVMLDVPFLHALTAHATGAVGLNEGDSLGALSALRKAVGIWQALEAPYEAARARVLIAAACRSLGDEDGASFERDAALQVFQTLDARPDLERASALSHARTTSGTGGLTARELDVLRLVATGKTNHAIAQELFLSDHTVRRHLQNVFAKLGVSSRAAATAFALQHRLI